MSILTDLPFGYVAIHKVKAIPLSLGDYNKYRGWNIPENEDPKKEGFLIGYENGHESWSPKETFESLYKDLSLTFTRKTIEELSKDSFYKMHLHSQLIIDLIEDFESISEIPSELEIRQLNSMSYEISKIREVFDQTKKEDYLALLNLELLTYEKLEKFKK